MTLSVIEFAQAATAATATTLNVAVATTPQPGDILVMVAGMNRTSTDRQVSAVSGLGATWSQLAHNTTSNNFSHDYWIGTGANASGNVLVTLASSRDFNAYVLVIRGFTGTPTAAVTATSASATSLTGPSQNAALGQFVLSLASGNPSMTWPSSQTPSASWTTKTPVTPGGGSFAYAAGYVIPSGASTAHSTSLTNPVATGSRISQMVLSPPTETTVSLPLTAGWLAQVVPPITTVELPLTLGWQGQAATAVQIPLTLGLGFEPATQMALPLALPTAFEPEVPTTTVDLPIALPWAADVAVQLALPIALGFAPTPATQLALPLGIPVVFAAGQDGETGVALGLSVGWVADPATSLSLPVGLPWVADVVPNETTVSLPLTLGLVFTPESTDTTVDLPLAIGFSTFVAARRSLWLPLAVAESGTQAVDFSIVPTSPETGVPVVSDGDELSNSLWLSFTSTGPQTLTVELTAGFSGAVEVWTGEDDPDPDSFAYLGSSIDAPLVVAIGDGERVLMRAHPMSAAETGSGTLTWSVASRPPEGVLQFAAADSIVETPGWMPVTIASATPSSTLEFSLDGGATVVFTMPTDELGLALGSVWLSELSLGAHTITVVDVTSGQSATESFQVELAVPPSGSTPPGGTPPPPMEVQRWEFVDPAPSGEVFTFPINPSSMSSPVLPRAITSEHTVYPGGQQILWEGTPEPVSWQIEGSVQTQAHYEALERFYALRRRFWVTDHLARSWVVAFDSLDFTEMRDAENDWANTYVAKFILLGGPVTAP